MIINIYHVGKKQKAEMLMPLAESIGKSFSDDYKINILHSMDDYVYSDLIISSSGTGHNSSKSARAMLNVLKNHKAPKIVCQRRLLKGFSKLILTFSYVDLNNEIKFFPKDYRNEERAKYFLKKYYKRNEIEEEKKGRSDILICAQNKRPPYFHFKKNIKYSEWLENSISYIKSKTKRNVILRPHPRGRYEGNKFELYLKDKYNIEISPIGRGLEADMERASLIVTYNSSLAISAVLKGIPVVIGDNYFLDNQAVIGYNNFKKASIRRGREEWLKKIINATWTKQEIRGPESGLKDYIFSFGLEKEINRRKNG